MYNFIFIILFILAFIGFASYTLAKDNAEKSAIEQLEQLSKSEYAKQLNELPLNPETWQEPVGAMCYDTAAPLDRVQYVCPVCGEVTLYPSYFDESFTIEHISYLRSLVKKITKLDVKLDESEFCEKCKPDQTHRKLCIIVKTGENVEPVRTCDISKTDIDLLYEYSEGKEHETQYNARLEELLGIKLENNDQ